MQRHIGNHRSRTKDERITIAQTCRDLMWDVTGSALSTRLRSEVVDVISYTAVMNVCADAGQCTQTLRVHRSMLQGQCQIVPQYPTVLWISLDLVAIWLEDLEDNHSFAVFEMWTVASNGVHMVFTWWQLFDLFVLLLQTDIRQLRTLAMLRSAPATDPDGVSSLSFCRKWGGHLVLLDWSDWRIWVKDAVVVEARDGNLACWICMGLSENWVPKKTHCCPYVFHFSQSK